MMSANSYKLVIFTLMVITIAGFHACKHEPLEPTAEQVGGPGGGGGSDDDTTEVVECDPNIVYFQQEVLPIFQSSCALPDCHSAANAEDGVILTDYQSIISTGDIEGGDLNAGKIYELITETDIDAPEDRMPPVGNDPLTQEQIDAIANWILQGAQNNSCEPTTCNLENVTYSGTIRPIIVNHCEGCHSGPNPSGGLNYTTYDGVASVAADGLLLDAVTWAEGVTNMPFNGDQLSQCKIDQIQTWIDNGYPND